MSIDWPPPTGDRPRAVVTGGSLLVGAVERTDLIDPSSTEALARALWRSINGELLTLPDDVAVFPTHGAGSFCSAAGGARRWTTIGAERRANPLLRVEDEDAFVRAVLGSFGSYPPYFLRLRERNRLGPRVFGAITFLDRLDAGHVARLRGRGAVVVDVRPVGDYAAGHIPASLANTLRPQFASWLGWLVEDRSVPLVFVTDDHTDRRELLRQCLNIGYEHLAGEIGIDAWRAGGGDVTTTTMVSAEEMDARRVVDVRQPNEFASGHVPGASNVSVSVRSIEALAALYPAVWGLGQLVTGTLSDCVGRKWLIAGGMWVQAGAIAVVAETSGFAPWAGAVALLGAGTALVYPTLLAAIGDVAHPSWRASSVGVYRLWRDSGFAVGALVAGTVADAVDLRAAIWVVAALTAASGLVVAVRMYETRRAASAPCSS